MNIQEALKETGKAQQDTRLNDKCFAMVVSDRLCWQGERDSEVSYSNVVSNDWQPYHPVLTS